jgi:transposase
VWDNVNTHVSAVMRALIKTQPWLTVYRFPPYAPELNPVEGVWWGSSTWPNAVSSN